MDDDDMPKSLEDALDRLADALTQDDDAGEQHGELACLVIAWLDKRDQMRRDA